MIEQISIDGVLYAVTPTTAPTLGDKVITIDGVIYVIGEIVETAAEASVAEGEIDKALVNQVLYALRDTPLSTSVENQQAAIANEAQRAKEAEAALQANIDAKDVEILQRVSLTLKDDGSTKVACPINFTAGSVIKISLGNINNNYSLSEALANEVFEISMVLKDTVTNIGKLSFGSPTLDYRFSSDMTGAELQCSAESGTVTNANVRIIVVKTGSEINSLINSNENAVVKNAYLYDADHPQYLSTYPAGTRIRVKWLTAPREWNIQGNVGVYIRNITANANTIIGSFTADSKEFDAVLPCAMDRIWIWYSGIPSAKQEALQITFLDSPIAKFVEKEVAKGSYASDYCTIVALEDALKAKLSTNACEYCVDGDGVWKSLPADTYTETILQGQSLSFRCVPTTFGAGVGTFTVEGGTFKVKGNVMSLLYGENFVKHVEIDRSINAAFNSLFNGCTGLTDASELVLPAKSVANRCYQSMFANCTSLVAAPKLPATTLGYYCYNNMFYNCKSLVVAPVLPAITLGDNSYNSMFYGCSSLKYIKAMFTTPPSSSYTNNWVYGVAPTGTFVKSKDATWDVWGASGIPNGWTITT